MQDFFQPPPHLLGGGGDGGGGVVGHGNLVQEPGGESAVGIAAAEHGKENGPGPRREPGRSGGKRHPAAAEIHRVRSPVDVAVDEQRERLVPGEDAGKIPPRGDPGREDPDAGLGLPPSELPGPRRAELHPGHGVDGDAGLGQARPGDLPVAGVQQSFRSTSP